MKRALVVIDVQNEYVTGRLPVAYPPVDETLANIGRAIDGAHALDTPVVVTQDTGPADDPIFAEGTDGWLLHDVVSSRSHEHLLRKTLPSAFAGTDLELWLRTHGVDTIALVGYMTHHLH
jgi:nicotinamidase-related amidase